jgi:GNAT superfamily N-acetyltransferase
MIVREAELADALAIAHVHVDSWRTTYRGIVPDDYLAGLSYDRRAATWANILGDRAGVSFVYVAEDDGGAVVGFVSGGPIRDAIPDYDGELYAIYLLEPFHRRDIGRQLVAAAAGRRALGGGLGACGEPVARILRGARRPRRRRKASGDRRRAAARDRLRLGGRERAARPRSLVSASGRHLRVGMAPRHDEEGHVYHS